MSVKQSIRIKFVQLMTHLTMYFAKSFLALSSKFNDINTIWLAKFHDEVELLKKEIK